MYSLGITFSYDVTRIHKINLKPITVCMQQCLGKWSKQKLSLLVKISVENICFSFTNIISNGPCKQIKQRNKRNNTLMFKLLWDSDQDKIERHVIF